MEQDCFCDELANVARRRAAIHSIWCRSGAGCIKRCGRQWIGQPPLRIARPLLNNLHGLVASIACSSQQMHVPVPSPRKRISLRHGSVEFLNRLVQPAAGVLLRLEWQWIVEAGGPAGFLKGRQHRAPDSRQARDTT